MYQCQSCNAQFAKWSGKCLKCGAWNTLTEYKDLSPKLGKKSKSMHTSMVTVTALSNPGGVITPQIDRVPLPSDELSRVLGG